jgi:hypothetical protein
LCGSADGVLVVPIGKHPPARAGRKATSISET